MNSSSESTTATGAPEKARPCSTLARSVVRGTVGFTAVSLAAFSVWAFGGRWFYANVGEVGLYAATTLVFLALSGLLLHPLARPPGSLLRFYKAFAPAFVAYAIVWSAAWFASRKALGEWLGSLAGSAVFAVVAGRTLGSLRGWAKVVAVLFVTHSAGYFLGGALYTWSKQPAALEVLSALSKAQVAMVGRLGWGLLYGLGFGAGLGYAFFTFQRPAREPEVSAQ